MSALDAFAKVDFDWAVHLDAIWRDHPGDVPALHGNLRQEISHELIQLAGPHPPLGWIIVGAGGSGKTHLISALRRSTFDNDAIFISIDMTDVRDFYETVLLGYITSLFQPNRHNEPQFQAVLAQIVDMLNAPTTGNEFVGQAARSGPNEVGVLTNMLLQRLNARYPQATLTYQDVIRAIVLLSSEDFEIQSTGYTWLQGAVIDDSDKQAFKFRQDHQSPSRIIQGLSWFLSLGAPTLLALDQLDAIVQQHDRMAKGEDREEPAGAHETAEAIITSIAGGLSGLRDLTTRTLIVLSCIEGTYEILRTRAERAFMDRYQRPRELAPPASRETAEALIAERLAPAYDEAGFSAPYPTWPFKPEAFEGAIGLLPRELLQRCTDHREKCLREGQITELSDFSKKKEGPGPITEHFEILDRLLSNYRNQVNLASSFAQENEDGELAEVIAEAAWYLVIENPVDKGVDVLVDVEFPGGRNFKPLHARIRKVFHDEGGHERHYCMRALQKTNPRAYQARLNAAMTSSGIDRNLPFRKLILFRSTAIPNGVKTQQMTNEFYQRGGLMVKPSEDDLRTVWAVRELEKENHPGFRDWLQARRPVSSLAMMREARLARGRDEEGASDRPAPPPREPQTANGAAGTDKKEPDGGQSGGTGTATTGEVRPRGEDPAAKPEEGSVARSAHDRFPVGYKIMGGQSTDEAVELPLRVMRQHALVLAGAGSGKTVLVRRIVEEAALLGIPSIVVDAANDLAQLGDPWPDTPEAWREGDAAKAAAYFDQTETVIWTPGLEGGNPVRLEPLPDFAAVNTNGDELEEAVAMACEALQPIVAPGNSERSRKRMGVLAAASREFAKHCPGPLPTFVEFLSDLPAEAGGGINQAPQLASQMADALRAKIQTDPLLRGEGRALDPAALFGLDAPSGKTRVSVLSFTGLQGEGAQQQFLNQLAMTLFTWIKRHPAKTNHGLRGLLVIDEAKDYVPAKSASVCKESLKRLAAQARKYGLGLVFATQAPKDIEHTIVSNCFTHFYGQANSPAAIDAIKEQLEQRGGSGEDIARLRKGKFYVYNSDVVKTPTKIDTPLCLSHHPAGPLSPEEIKERARRSREG